MSATLPIKQVEVFPSPKQEEFIFSDRKYTAFIGGVGSGKTWAGCLKSIMHCRPGYDGMIIAPTYPMLRDVTQRKFFELLEDAEIKYEFLKTEERAFVHGCNVFFRSADNPDRLRGPTLNWAYLDEAALMIESTWRIVLGRLRAGEPMAWITTTPAGFNWVYHYFAETKDDKYGMTQASTRENTHVPAEYIEDLVANYKGEFASQEIEGNFVAFEGLVYPEFNPSVHVIPPFKLPDHWQRFRAIDYGYTNPFVCVWGAVDEDGRLYIYDEHYQRKTLIAVHAETIRRRAGVYQFTVADHDAQDNAEMASCGIPTRNAQKDVIRGIQKVKSRLGAAGDGKPRLFLFANCVNGIKEAGMYRWAEVKEGRNEKEEPVKENDHFWDAVRYMAMELDNKRVYVFA